MSISILPSFRRPLRHALAIALMSYGVHALAQTPLSDATVRGLTNPTAAQIASLTGAQLNYLPSSVWTNPDTAATIIKNLSVEQTKALPANFLMGLVSRRALAAFSAFSAAQVAAMSPAQFTNLGNVLGSRDYVPMTFVNLMSEAQFAAITPTLIQPNLILEAPPPLLSALRKEPLQSKLSSFQAQALTLRQIVGMSAAEIKAVPPALFNYASAGWLALIPPTQLANLLPEQIGGINAGVTQTMSQEQWRALTGAQIERILYNATPARVAMLTANQLWRDTPPPTQGQMLINFPPHQLPYLAPELLTGKFLAAMTARADLVGALSVEQLRRIFAEQLPALSPQFFNYLSKDQLAVLTTEQRAKLTPLQKQAVTSRETAVSALGKKTPEEIAQIPPGTISPLMFDSLNAAQLGGLTVLQAEKLNISDISTEQIKALKPDVLVALVARFRLPLAGITPYIRPALTTDQLKALSVDQRRGIAIKLMDEFVNLK